MTDCERAAHAIAQVEIGIWGLNMVRESYRGVCGVLDGFPGTADERAELTEAMQRIESAFNRFQEAAWESAEDCGEGTE